VSAKDRQLSVQAGTKAGCFGCPTLLKLSRGAKVYYEKLAQPGEKRVQNGNKSMLDSVSIVWAVMVVLVAV
jgi:hypothetical protein